MLSPSRLQPNNTNKRTKKTSNTTFNNDSHREADVKRPRTNQLKVKSGDPSNVHISGKDVIEQAFSSN